MKKTQSIQSLRSLLILLFIQPIIYGSLRAQTVIINLNPGTSTNVIVGNSSYNVTEAIYLASEVGSSNFIVPANTIKSLGFSLFSDSANVATGFNIYLKNISAGTTTFTDGVYSTTGYTLVYSGAFIASDTGFTSLNLTTPFQRTSGSNLQLLVVRLNNVVSSPGPTFNCATGNSSSGTLTTSRRYNSSTLPVSGTTSISASNFRPALKLSTSLITAAPAAPMVITDSVASITAISANLGGTVSSAGTSAVAERGIVYATTINPILTNNKVNIGSGLGIFSQNVTGLIPNTTYHVRAYAINNTDTSYGGDSTFTTLAGSTAVDTFYWREPFTTPALGGTCNLTTVSPTANTSGYFNGAKSGVWWGKNIYNTTGTGCPAGNPHVRFKNIFGVTDSGQLVTPVVSEGIKAFYFYRARANRHYTIWITNDTLATTTNWTLVASLPASSLTATCVDTMILINSATAKRLRIKAAQGTDTDIDSIAITRFGTVATTPPIVATKSVLSITSSSAFLGVIVSNEGSSPVSQHGVVYATTINPTFANTKVSLGTGLGNVNTNVTGLTPATLYHVRAYAINSTDTSYGGDSTFNTLAIQPQLTLSVLLEGMYLGNNTMTAAPFSADGISQDTIADTITVELHQSTGSYNLVSSARVTLSTYGVANLSFPSSAYGNSYFLTVKHRNSIETWSAAPILLGASNIYQFNTSASQAFGDNLSSIGGGKFAIYSGDINQDGSIDFNDYPNLDIRSSNGDLGYLSEDLNGDASVDFNDYPLLDINSSNGIISLTP